DLIVTGVQACALPILEMNEAPAPVSNKKLPVAPCVPCASCTGGVVSGGGLVSSARVGSGPMNGLAAKLGPAAPLGVTCVKRAKQIGRASCRERRQGPG